MKVNYQVIVDCEDPHSLARFWAAALGWTVEDDSERITTLLTRGEITVGDTTTVDGKLAWRESAAVLDPTAPIDASGIPMRGRLQFQYAPGAKTAPSSVRLDIGLDVADREAEIDRLLSLGATRLWDGRIGAHSWATFADPEGNEFSLGLKP